MNTNNPAPMNRKTLALAEYHDALRAQSVPMIHLACVCPMCGTIQSPFDFIEAGAGKDCDAVERYIGFSCIGRWLNAEGPRAKPDGKPCNWTLGGLFKTHTLEVITPDGERHPRFEPASRQDAIDHMNVNTATAKAEGKA